MGPRISRKGLLRGGCPKVVSGAGRVFFRGVKAFILARADPLIVCTCASLALITVCNGCVLVIMKMASLMGTLLGDVGTKMNGLMTRNGGLRVGSMF